MPDNVRIVTHGIPQLQSALRKMGGEAAGELKAEFTRIAGIVAAAARGRVPHRSGRAAASIKARGSTRGGAIAFGGSAAPYMPWLDFGGSTGHGHLSGVAGSGAIKRDWMGNPLGEGRYVYPAIRSQRDTIIKETDEVIERLAKKAGFETHG